MDFDRVTTRYPLSPMQQGMLFHYLKEPHSGVDIEQLVVHLPEAIDAVRLEAACQWLVRRHAILRTRFEWEEVEQPQQEVLADVASEFTVAQPSAAEAAGEDARRACLTSFLQADRLRGFDLNRAPMLRFTLFQWGPQSFTLVWTFHHALLDGRTYATLLRELFEAYEELSGGAISPRPEPPKYERYIEWMAAQNFSQAEPFWNNLLAGFTAPTPLVVDRKSPSEEALYQQGEAWEILERTTTASLHNLAGEHELTMNTLVMGAWAILLRRYSGERDIVFGATRACRKS
jgi:NRPS condensation-like uncharacterized protein